VPRKRLFDLIFGGALAIAVTPIAAAVALVIRLMDGAPVLHRSTRVGQGGRPFTLLKFRTMRTGEGLAVTGAGDPRITRVGRALRRTKLDELPQLVNVLRGEMSLVGPRPEDPRYVALYTDEQRAVLRLRPGITSPAAVAYRDEEQLLTGSPDDIERRYLEEVLPAKLALDLAYAQRPTLAADLRVLAATFRALLPRR
jgi:lipopolysaccharide/colanic/teichoic acid biosynthesis glycosyltransferase